MPKCNSAKFQKLSIHRLWRHAVLFINITWRTNKGGEYSSTMKKFAKPCILMQIWSVRKLMTSKISKPFWSTPSFWIFNEFLLIKICLTQNVVYSNYILVPIYRGKYCYNYYLFRFGLVLRLYDVIKCYKMLKMAACQKNLFWYLQTLITLLFFNPFW